MSLGGSPYDITGHFQYVRYLLVYSLDCKARASTTLTEEEKSHNFSEISTANFITASGKVDHLETLHSAC
jgi:hypothetical protein